MRLDDYEILIRCNCYSHIGWLWVDSDEEGKPIYFTIASIYPDRRLTGELRERLKALWLILRGRRHWFEELVLTEPDARELRDFLDSRLADSGLSPGER